MKRLIVLSFVLLLCAAWFFAPAKFWQAVTRAASRAPQTKPDFDIRAGLQRTLNDPADAVITVPLVPPAQQAEQQAERPAVRRSALPYALRNAHPTVQMKWSTLTQAPSRLWSSQDTLSAPSRDDAELIARRFLNDNADLLRLGNADVAALKTARRYQDAHNGLTHLWLQQNLDGIEVFQGDLAFHLAKSGEIVAVSGEALPDIATLANARKPRLSAIEALRLAAADAEAELDNTINLKTQPEGAEQKQVFDRAAGFARDVEARLVYFPLTNTQVRLAWQYTLWMMETADVYLTLIDAEKGSVLFRYNLTCYDENPLKPHGQVFTKDAPLYSVPYTTSNPAPTPREDVPFRAGTFNGADLFPISDPHYDWWAGQPATGLISNNTDVHLDRDANNVADLPRVSVADGNFTFPLDLTKQPAADADYQRAAQANLFYWVNRYHDILYNFGFTEAAGNFQTDNFGKGGRGADAVQGDAQDGSGTNNANFSTPPDGNAGRVQMYLWTSANPQRDGDFDQEVVIHELTHGLSNRLVGNAAGLTGNQSRGMGEGWSDYFGMVLLRSEADDVNAIYPSGQYVVNNYPFGIRRFPYSTSLSVYPYTFKDLRLSTEVHDEGEIWCNTLLEMRALLITRYGFKEGQRQSIQLVVDGLKLTPRAPSFLDARDAILLADRVNNASANQCLIWQAFAKRGMGFDAFTPDASDGAPDESLANAPYCSVVGSLRADKANYVSGETLKLNLGDANAVGTPAIVATTTITGDREVFAVRANPNIRGSFDGQIKLGSGRALIGDGVLQGSVEAGDELILTYTDANTGAGAAQTQLRLPFTREKAVFNDTIENGNQGWLPGGTWGITNARGSSPSRSWTDSPAGNYANNTDTTLVSPQFDFSGLSNVTLSFAQSFDIEEGFDFGGIEVSNDDGQSWRRVTSATGTQTDFRQAQVRLRALDNQPRARIRFHFTSDTAVIADGWYVDDIRITARSASPNIIPPGTDLSPALGSATPAFGPITGGTRVTLFGTNFTESEDTQVTFDGRPATNVTVVSPFVLTAVAPAHAAGAVNVRVTNRNGAVALGQGFTYYTTGTTVTALKLNSLFPTFGSVRGGTTVTLLGENLTPETQVTFDGRAATVTYVNPGVLRAVTPFAPSALKADVIVKQGTASATSAGAFSYINPTPPTVDVLTPDGGETVTSGSVVSIRWNSSDNSALAAHRVSLFRPGGVLGQTFVSDLAVNLAGNARNFNWTVPFNLAAGDYRIRVIATDDEGTETEAYSANTFALAQRWQAITSLPLTSLARQAGASDGRFVYVIGGRNATTTDGAQPTVYRLDPNVTPLTWNATAVPPMPTALANADAVFLNGKIYIPGGTNSANTTVATHLVYDTAANTWSTAANVPTGSTFYALAADPARGVFYYTGGNSSLTAVRVYNPANDTWASLPTMTTNRTQHESAVIDGKLYVAGGINNSGGLRSTEAFDFSTQRWTPLASLNRARAFFAANVVLRDAANNPYWVLVGGQDQETGAVLGPEVYDVRNDRWIVLDNSFNLLTPRFVYGQAIAGTFFYALGGATPTIGPFCERLRLDVPFNLTPFNISAPVLAVPETVVAIAGNETQFEVLANDISGNTALSLTAAGLPPAARFETVVSSNNSLRGKFRWTPAAGDAGRTFTVTFTASDGLASDTKLVNVRVVTAKPMAAVNSADFRAGGLAPDSLASLFGTDLAVRTEVASDVPLPFELSGTTVTVNGVRAQLVFVSPGQINFVVPANTVPGLATLVVSTPTGTYSVTSAQIVASLPAIFTKDNSGKGEANALSTTDGVRFLTSPFDVLVNGRPNVLVLFGTGFRRAQAANPNDGDGVAEAVTATIGGQPARVLFAGAQGGFSGLDQINIELPAALAGGSRRFVDVVLSVNGDTANRVTIEIK